MSSDYSLYLVTDRSMCAPKGLPAVVELLIPHGISYVQLRMKDAATATILETGYALKNPTQSAPYKINHQRPYRRR